MPLRLPRPDEFGNFWFREGKLSVSGILPSKRLKDGNVVVLDTWIVLVNEDQGFVFEGNKLMVFYSAEEALVELQRRLARGKG